MQGVIVAKEWMMTEKARIDTVLQGYQVESKEGDIAFCGVNLIEAPDGRGGITPWCHRVSAPLGW